MAKINPIKLQKHLKGIDYPANKEKLIKHAQQHGADEQAISALEQLPDEEFASPTKVSKAVSNMP
jgi:Protein of unknown function (DUF2795)